VFENENEEEKYKGSMRRTPRKCAAHPHNPD